MKYPTVQELGLPIVPPAPTVPDREPEKVGSRLYTSASRLLYGRSSIVRDEEMLQIMLAMEAMKALDIKPAEWILSRLNYFAHSALAERLPRAPVKYVFSQKAIAESNFVGGDLSVPRPIMTTPAIALVKDMGKLSSLQYGRRLSEVKSHNRTIQKLIDDKISAGEFVWMESVETLCSQI